MRVVYVPCESEFPTGLAVAAIASVTLVSVLEVLTRNTRCKEKEKQADKKEDL